ncbi:MAG: ABC transporter substrate-binding protein [Hormoscilla sp.]
MAENGITAELEPALAESWVFGDDRGRRITFTLRPGLKWSDGEPLTADDVVFTFKEIYLNPKIPTVYRDFLRIGSTFPTVRKLDDRRVEFILPEPFAPFVRYMTKMAIMPAHALQDSVRSLDSQGKPQFIYMWGTSTDPKNIISNGPYRLVSYRPGERVVLERNPYYWQKDDRGNPMPYIDRLVIQIISSTDNQLIKFRSGSLDSINVNPEAFRLLKRESKRGKYTIYNGGPSIGFRVLSFNLNRGRNTDGEPLVDPIKSRWFNNLAFRQAVAYAIDRERMKNNIYRGLSEVQISPIPVQSPYYLEELKLYNYDPQKAKKLLRQAGFQYNGQQQLLDWDGNQVQFTMMVGSGDNMMIDTAVQIKENLDHIGIKVDLQVLNLNLVLRSLLATRKWESVAISFGAFGADVEPHLLSSLWSSGGPFHAFNLGPQPGQPPISGWLVSDWEREIDSLFAAGAAELDENKRQQIYGRFQQIVAEQLPVFFLVNQLYMQAVRDRVQNIKFSANGGPFWNIEELSIAPNFDIGTTIRKTYYHQEN